MNLKRCISIIIPVFNRYNFIGETIDSILFQNFENWECIIVDDGSKDYIDELMDFYCEKDDRIKFFKRPVSISKGANSCRNFGYYKSSGNIIIWFDSDDVFVPTAFAQINKNFQDNKLLIYPAWKTDNYLKIIKEMGLFHTDNLFRDYLLWEFKIVTNSVAFKRSFLRTQSRLFVEEIHFGHETTFFANCFFSN